MSKRKRDRVDLVDAELVEEMLHSAGWQLTAQRIRKAVDDVVQRLIACDNEAESARLRGEIAGLRLALLVPTILKNEAKETVRKNG